MKKKVLFICTNNSARFQIAEGFLNTLFKNNYEVFSAGTQQSSLNPYAVEVMKEVGIDISNYRSISIEGFKNHEFDFVITLCDNVKKTCPFFPGKKVIYKSFEDPAAFEGNIEDTLNEFRKIRDEIKNFLIIEFGE
jgi:arsenate reductase (thioredoxin)